MRGYTKSGVVDAIRAAGGEVYAITSEPQSLARNAREDWATGLEHVGDPHHEIASACAARGWLSLFTNARPEELGKSAWRSHPRGYFQPGVLALRREGQAGREDRVLYRWRSRPTRNNVGGAIARPTPAHVWSRVEAALREAPGAPDVALDADPVLDSPRTPWLFFVALLLANGWFLRPVTFDHRPGKDTVSKRIRNATLRIPVFIGAWIAAALLLPFWIVALAFAGWVAKVVPGIRTIHRQFQNLRPDEEPA